MTIGKTKMVRLPGTSKLDLMVPNIQYGQALEIAKAHIEELERDLPEMAYYRLRDRGDNLSGVAIKALMMDALDKALEARGNGEDAMVRANQMALTIGQHLGIFDESLGTYESGALDHHFSEREVFTTSEIERLNSMKPASDMGVPLVTLLRWAGWSDDEILDMETDKAKAMQERANTLGQSVLENLRAFDRGLPGVGGGEET